MTSQRRFFPQISPLTASKQLPDLQAEMERAKTTHLHANQHGIFVASSSQETSAASGYQHAWIRDNVMIALSFWVRGDQETSRRCVDGLWRFMQTQTSRFEAIIREPILKTTNPQERPHVRFDANHLVEIQQPWAHDQNDALGYLLYFRFLIANELRETLYSGELRFYELFPAYFRSIQYWADGDSGVWEEARRCNSSSVGAVIAGLTQLGRFYKENWRYNNSDLVAEIADLIAQGQQTLSAQLPFESRSPAVKIDAAPLLLIYPAQVVTDVGMQDFILSLVRARLVGPKGIRRYVGDSYFCQDYDEWFAPETRTADFSNRLELRDAFLRPGCEAQWCLFDPLLSVIYGRRFLKTDSPRDLKKQLNYFNRAIGQLTLEGQCPELYFLKDGEYVPNEHTPLAWTQANLALAVHFLEQSVHRVS